MSYLGNQPRTATFAIDTFNGDGGTLNFTLREAPVSVSSILVFVGGVRQATDTYTLSGATLSFTEAPPTGTNNIQVLFLGLGASPAVPSDKSVTPPCCKAVRPAAPPLVVGPCQTRCGKCRSLRSAPQNIVPYHNQQKPPS